MREITELKSRAKVIDLGRGEAEVYDEFRGLVNKEARLAHYAGLKCDLKWTEADGQRNPCDTCPYHQTHTSDEDATAVLCRLGMEQNALLDEMAAIRATDLLDDALMATYEADSAYCDDVLAALD